MKLTTLKKQSLFFISLLYLSLVASPAFASAPSFLTGVATKIQEVNDSLSGPIATAVITIVIVVFGFSAITGRINKIFGFGICAGALIITFAPDIASWITSGG